MIPVVYTLSDPTTGAIRYVGKTSRGVEQRLKEHLLPKNLKAHTHKNMWLRQLLGAGQKPVIEIVEESTDANEAERFWIAQFRALGFKLTNLTHGGEGTTGYRFKRPPEQCIANGARKRGKRLSDDHRLKLSRATKGRAKRPFSAEHRANIAAARLGTKMPPRTEAHRLALARSHGGRAIVDQHGNRYETVRGAARALGLHAPLVTAVLQGRQHHTGGYVFKWAE
jgi:hypothetical protein